ncbi:uncharacterized protein LOC105699993 isoform X2 [Orussus abietinus]|uniref:uncharacterized protein LOC105699993 isoform X2 n=1 Tax=Orussus abietinus TaxID=222816 RepID=UPI000626C189|nr:uncharacterized protein LOC105699993 isoform X2 [Orussus abietinus]
MEIEIWRVTSSRVLLLLLVATTFFVRMTCQDSSLESYEDKYDDSDPEVEQLNGDEDDEKGISFPFRAETEVYTTLAATPRKKGKCDEDQILQYLAELRVINPESILLIASYKDLELLCRRIATNLDSFDAFMQSCIPLPQDHLYLQLMIGIRVLYGKLCVPSEYQRGFKKYASCYQELHHEYFDCGGPADWTENMEDQELCDQYKAIADCYFTKTAMLCGIKAAKTMKELVVRVINAVIDSHCPELRKNPSVPNPMPDIMYKRSLS